MGKQFIRKQILSLLLVVCMFINMIPSTAIAAISDSLRRTPEENQEILEELTDLIDEDRQKVYDALQALGLLDEDGNLKLNQTVNLDGEELTLEQVMTLLEDPSTDLSRIGTVDGVPIALGDLKTIIQIEQELSRIEQTYFSGKTFTGEALDNLNSLLNQLETSGITLFSVSERPDSNSVNVIDVGTWNGNLNATLYTFDADLNISKDETIAFSYRVNKGLLGDYMEEVKVQLMQGETLLAEAIKQEDGSYRLSYTSTSEADIDAKIKITVQNAGVWMGPDNVYGDLSAFIDFYDGGNTIFFDGYSYDDHYSLKITKHIEEPTILLEFNNDQETLVENSTGSTDYPWFDFLRINKGDGRDSDYEKMRATANILYNAKREMDSQANIYYQLNAKIKLDWGQRKFGEYTDKIPDAKAPYGRLGVLYINNASDYLIDGKTVIGASLVSATSEQGSQNKTIQPIEIVKNKEFEIQARSSFINQEGLPKYLEVDLTVGRATGQNPYWNAHSSSGSISFLDYEDPWIKSIEALAGTYTTGHKIPITMKFNEMVFTDNSTRITINGIPYSPAELDMKTQGNQLVAWYTVQEFDTTELDVSSIAGVKDAFGKELTNETGKEFTGKTFEDVKQESTLMRYAPTDMTVSFENGQVGLSMSASMDFRYKNVYANYHTPAGTEKQEAPFRVQLYNNWKEAPVASLQVYQTTSEDERDHFEIESYPIALLDQEQSWDLILQANEGDRDTPNWVNIMTISKKLTIPKKVNVAAVTIAVEVFNYYTLSLSDDYRPKFIATITGENGQDPSYTTGKWSSSNEEIATIDQDGQVTLTGNKLGAVRFKFTADNGTPDDPSDDKSDDGGLDYRVVAGDIPALIIPSGSSTIFTRKDTAATVLWSSNANFFAPDKDFVYTVEVFDKNYSDNNEIENRTPIYTTTAAKDTNSVIIPRDKITKISNNNTPRYTVRVSMPHPLMNDESVTLSVMAWIVVWPSPAKAELKAPDNIYITENDIMSFTYKITNASEGMSQSLLITKITEDNTSSEFYRHESTNEPNGSITRTPDKVADGQLKDIYQVTLTVQNPGQDSPSVDAFPFYVYNSDALKLQVDGLDVSSVVIDNTSKVNNSLPEATSEIMALRQELGLIEYIGINYNDYKWNSFIDGIKWLSSNDGHISVNYKQGGLYENIKNYKYATYLPETKMALSSVIGGTATITATHANTGMTASVEVTANTLQDKFYLFQLKPAQRTTLVYTDGQDAEKTVYTNDDGVLALYEPNGIASDIYLRAGVKADTYLGTIHMQDLQSGERDATKLRLYPLNTFTLRRVARAEIYLTLPNGDPLANKNLTIHGGVYKNDGYCQYAEIGPGVDERQFGTIGQTYITDKDGKLTVYLDSTQFWLEQKGETSFTELQGKDRIKYILEISNIDGDKYYPLFITVDSGLGLDSAMYTAEGIISLEEVEAGKERQPFVVTQTIDYQLPSKQKIDVKNFTGRVGPNSSYKRAFLETTMYLWGVGMNNYGDYSLEIIDEFDYMPSAQEKRVFCYPFSTIPIADNTLRLNEESMTNSGWIDVGDEVGLKTRVSKAGTLVHERDLSFRAIDLTRVPKVKESDEVSNILLNMQESSSIDSAMRVEDKGALDDVLSVLSEVLEELSGPVESSFFKILISPSEDASVFKALISAGYDSLGLEEAEYVDGVAMSTDFLSSSTNLGVPGTEDVGDMANGSYDPFSSAAKNKEAGKFNDAELNFQLEGLYEAEIRYNLKESKWEIFTIGGGFTVGIGGSYAFNVNTNAGPVPITASFKVGGGIQLSFKTAVRYSQIGNNVWEDPSVTAVNDYLTNLRFNAYVEGFGGIGFDYSVIALKIGLYGRLAVDSQNKFLSRPYLKDVSQRQRNGQALNISGEVGIKFVAQLLFIEHETVLASIGFSATKTFNDWAFIDDYWKNTGSGIMGSSLRGMAAQSGLRVSSYSVTLQKREYLEEYARTWGKPKERISLFALNDPSGLENLQTNANPASYPILTNDGKLLAYISDANSPSVYDSRAHYSTLSGSSYNPSIRFPSPDDGGYGFDGYGDSNVTLAGSGDFAAAAWIRMGERLDKDAGDDISVAEQNMLMNSSEIVVSIYEKDSGWTSTRLTNDGTPDLAPTIAANNDSAVVFWRSVYSTASETEGNNSLLNFQTKDSIMYSQYNGTDWSEPKMIYNGYTGAVKALGAAMLPDGTAIAVYTIDREGNGNTKDYEVAYTIVDNIGTPGMTMVATHNNDLDENPQVVAANFGTGDDRFVVGWHSMINGESDIRMLAVSANGAMSNKFPESLSHVTAVGGARVGGDFKFASLGDGYNSIENLTILWSEKETSETGGTVEVDHSIIKAVKLRYEDNTNNNLILSAPLELAKLPERTLADCFDGYVSGPSEVKAVIQATYYDPYNNDVIGGVSVPKEEVKLFTATSSFETVAAELERIDVDYATLSLNSLIPVKFTIRNTGLDNLAGLTVSLGMGETATENKVLLPNESTTLTVWHKVGSVVSNVDYTLTDSSGKINVPGKVYLDYPDIGISKMEVTAEEMGMRTVRMTLYNASAATLAGGKGRDVRLSLYTDSMYEEKVTIGLNSQSSGLALSGKTLIISGEDELSRIDQGAFTCEITYDLGSYIRNELNQQEIPEVGIYLYADAKIMGSIDGIAPIQEMPEYNSANNRKAVLLTGALGRTGQAVSLNIEQGIDSTGDYTTANISLRNNSLETMTSGGLVASLLGSNGDILETIRTDISGSILGESSQESDITFSGLGNRVRVTTAVEGQDTLTFDGLGVSIGNFSEGDSNNYTYSVQGGVYDDSTLVTAISANGEKVIIEGTEFIGGSGSLAVELDPETTTSIVVKIGEKTYILELVSYSLTFEANGGSLITPIRKFKGTVVSLEDYKSTLLLQVFDGWFEDEELTLPITSVRLDQDIKIYAGWRDYNGDKVTLDGNGGIPNNDYILVNENEPYNELPRASRMGYAFVGWFTESIGGIQVTSDTIVTIQGEHTLYAHWTDRLPSEPQNLIAISSDGQVALSWVTPATGGAIVYYEVSMDNGSNWARVDEDQPLPYVYIGLVNDMEYTFMIKALNDLGWGPEASISFTPKAVASIPDRPDNFMAMPSDGQVTLSWSRATSGSAITYYELSKDNGLSWINVEDNTEYTFYNLINNTEYTFRVRGVNGLVVGEDASVTSTPIAPGNPPNITYAVNFYISEELYSSVNTIEGTSLGINWPSAPINSGFIFAGWYTGQHGIGEQYTSSTIINDNMNLYAKWVRIVPSAPSIDVIEEEERFIPSITLNISVTATLDKEGIAIASISDKTIKDAIAKARADAKAKGQSENDISIKLEIALPEDATSCSIMMSQDSLQALVEAEVFGFKLDNILASIGFDLMALREILKQSDGDITIEIVPSASLADVTQDIIGTRPVYDISINYIAGNTITTLSDFGEANLTIAIHYQLGEDEEVAGLYIVYIDKDGGTEHILSSAYDANIKAVIFSTRHLSQYGIGYTAPSNKYDDITSHWAKESISYILAKGLIAGAAKKKFSPDLYITRGAVVTALGRVAKVNISDYSTSSFSDVKAGTTYSPYIEWAYKEGIIEGINKDRFEPNRSIKREEMAMIFKNFAKVTNYNLLTNRKAIIYTDDTMIDKSYKEAVIALQQAGIMMGKDGNKFNPKAKVSRAELSIMLHRYIMLVIDRDTTQGWALNDSGQYLYYKDGVALTGKQMINQVEYNFNTEGILQIEEKK